MKYNIYLVRHGQTYYNIMRKMQGWSNSPLTKRGIADAEVVGTKLQNIHFAAAFCSDLSRAIITSKIILKDNADNSVKQPIISKYLRDCFYGEFEGEDIDQTWKRVGQKHGYQTYREIVTNRSLAQAKDWLSQIDRFHLAENNEQYWLRMEKGIDLMRETYLPENSNIFWVSHGMTCLSLAEKYGHGAFDITKRPENGSISKMVLTEDNLKFIYYNRI